MRTQKQQIPSHRHETLRYQQYNRSRMASLTSQAFEAIKAIEKREQLSAEQAKEQQGKRST